MSAVDTPRAYVRMIPPETASVGAGSGLPSDRVSWICTARSRKDRRKGKAGRCRPTNAAQDGQLATGRRSCDNKPGRYSCGRVADTQQCSSHFQAHQDNSSADDDSTDQGRGEGHDNSGNGHETEHVHTSHGHHYGHERHQDSSAQHARQDEAPGNSEYGHSHSHGHVDEQDIPPGRAHSTQENGSHGRGHDH